ncbi:MAG: cell division protein FtsH, partial [bacterium]|nr:cell division protein FtsH [bacterium]
REEILKVHTRKTVLAPHVDLSLLARGTPGFSGADLENLVNEAALNAARYEKKNVQMEDFEQAKDKVMMGAERRGMIISEEEKRTIAYHESGHTLVARKLPGTDPVHKVSIIPRGMALGVTQQLPIDDRHLHSKEYAENTISVLMGGRSAEELIFNMQTTGAGDDINKATELAHKMVCEWGMSGLGPLSFGSKETEIFLGRDFTQKQEYSEKTAISIDAEIEKLVTVNYERAKRILRENVDTLHRLAKTLLEFESLDGDQIDRVIRGEVLEPPHKKEVAKQKVIKQERSTVSPKIIPEPSKA